MDYHFLQKMCPFFGMKEGRATSWRGTGFGAFVFCEAAKLWNKDRRRSQDRVLLAGTIDVVLLVVMESSLPLFA